MITLTKVVQTCWGCPSQWDAWDADGRYYYLRYRWGCGTIETSAPEFDRGWEPRKTVASFSRDDPWDGVISLEDFLSNVPQVELASDVY